MQKIINDLWYARRDLISDGFDSALNYISELIPLSIIEIPTGTECWTWIVPPKWSLSEGWISNGGEIVLDVSDHPLHVMSYSQPIRKRIKKEELMAHIYTYPERPNAIPFGFSYYENNWKFCIQHNKLAEFREDNYDICIDAKFTEGTLKVGELVIPGKSKQEIALIAHLCHPSMANDNLSGVAVLIETALELLKQSQNKYTYRFLFLPEAIGSLAYLSQNEYLIPSIKYAIIVDSVGHNDVLSLQHSRQANTELDICASYVFKDETLMYREGAINKICGSDERIFNGPGVDIPSICISRFKFMGKGGWPYPEYHSSDDIPDIIIIDNLVETKNIIIKMLDILNKNYVPKRNFKGPICLSRYGLWVDSNKDRRLSLSLSDIMSSLEGDKSVLEIAKEVGISFSDLFVWLDKLHKENLLRRQSGVPD
jgi:aminopeptidase-like protein